MFFSFVLISIVVGFFTIGEKYDLRGLILGWGGWGGGEK